MPRYATTILLTLSMSCSTTNANHATITTEPRESSVRRFGDGEVERFVAGEALLAEAGLRGAFVMRHTGADEYLVAHPALAEERFSPASTFKIPNALIGLETGVITDASFTLPWDGTTYAVDGWNRDHDLASALRDSVVWFFQAVARGIGRERMEEWISRFDYGNGEIGAEVDSFWLDGTLTISTHEQVRFLERLNAGELPLSSRSVSILRQAMPLRRSDSVTIRAKTGTQLDAESGLAWLVGWTEVNGEIASHFALLLTGERGDVSRFQRTRWDLAQSLLEAAQPSEG